MGDLLALTAGGTLPEVAQTDPATPPSLHTPWSPDVVADHIGVTNPERTRRGDAVADPEERPFPTHSSVSPGPRSSRASVRSRACSTWSTWTTASTCDRVSTPQPTAGAELSIAATRAGVVDTTAGQVISVDVRISAGDELIATAAGALHGARTHRLRRAGRPGLGVPDAEDKPRARLDRFTVTAPHHMGAFAAVSGDHNPLHTDVPAARLAGFDGPIVARHVALRRRAARCCVGGCHPPPAADPQLAGPLGRTRCCRTPRWRSPSSAPAWSAATPSSR